MAVTTGADWGFLDLTLVRKLVKSFVLGWYLGRLREDSVCACK